MGLITQSNKQDDAIFVRFNASSGKFVERVEAGTEGAVERTNKSGNVVHEKSYPGVIGKLAGMRVAEDTTYPGLDVRMALKSDDSPTVVSTFRLYSEENGIRKWNRAVIQMLSALDQANLNNDVRLSIAYQPAGSKFTAKDGTEVVREHGQSTIFVGNGNMADFKDFIRADLKAIPEVEELKNASGRVVGKDDEKLEAYVAGLLDRLTNKVQAQRQGVDNALEKAGESTPADEHEFGIQDATPANEEEAGHRFG